MENSKQRQVTSIRLSKAERQAAERISRRNGFRGIGKAIRHAVIFTDQTEMAA